MKKITLLVCLVLSSMVTVFAQDGGKIISRHGGEVIGDDTRMKFEFVSKGSDIMFYPVAADGSTLKTVPASADVTVTQILLSETESYSGIQYENGCFTVHRTSEVPAYIVTVKTNYLDKEVYVKYKMPGVIGK
jgi:hypothetical protein